MDYPKNIFLADDDCDDVDFFTTALKDIPLNYELNVACDGKELIEKLSRTDKTPDIIFIDVNMPRMNGIDALSVIRNETPFTEIPVIVYSTSANETFIKKAYEAGASYYFTKPIDIKKLRDRIHNFLTMDWKKSETPSYENFAVSNLQIER